MNRNEFVRLGDVYTPRESQDRVTTEEEARGARIDQLSKMDPERLRHDYDEMIAALPPTSNREGGWVVKIGRFFLGE